MTLYTVQLSQEHEHLPLLELEAVLDAELGTYHIHRRAPPLIILEADTLPDTVMQRVAYAYRFSRVVETWETSAWQDLEVSTLTHPPAFVETGESFAVRAETIGDITVSTQAVERDIGAAIQQETGAAVDLEDPDTVIHVYLTPDTCILAKQIHAVNRSQYEKRVNKHRPFSKPVSLHPRTARAVVNLAHVKTGDAVLDPLCGTGGIVLEAGLIGCDAYGSDIDRDMVRGTRANLAAYDVDAVVEQCSLEDVETCFAGKRFDAVVTDFPYGQASKRVGNVETQFFDTVPDYCDGTVVCLSHHKTLKYKDTVFQPLCSLYVHQNMNRYIYRINTDALQ